MNSYCFRGLQKPSSFIGSQITHKTHLRLNSGSQKTYQFILFQSRSKSVCIYRVSDSSQHPCWICFRALKKTYEFILLQSGSKLIGPIFDFFPRPPKPYEFILFQSRSKATIWRPRPARGGSGPVSIIGLSQKLLFGGLGRPEARRDQFLLQV